MKPALYWTSFKLFIRWASKQSLRRNPRIIRENLVTLWKEASLLKIGLNLSFSWGSFMHSSSREDFSFKAGPHLKKKRLRRSLNFRLEGAVLIKELILITLRASLPCIRVTCRKWRNRRSKLPSWKSRSAPSNRELTLRLVSSIIINFIISQRRETFISAASVSRFRLPQQAKGEERPFSAWDWVREE